MNQGVLPQLQELVRADVGSARCGLLTDSSDRDTFILTPETTLKLHDMETNTDYFVYSVDTFREQWGHPLLLADITGYCTGNRRLCEFLTEHKREIIYSVPAMTAILGLDHIAVGERYGYTSPIKVGLRMAMVLSHMARKDDDPITFNEEEKSILLRARTGGVPPEERVDIYRWTISPENINRLLKMPDHPTIKTELFRLIEEELRRL